MSNSPAHASPLTAESMPLREAGLVGAGGAIGAVLRVLVASSVAAAGASGLAATQIVNLVGAFALGVFVAGLEARGPRPRWRAFLAVGVLGSFTTFSTLVGDEQAVSAGFSAGIALAFLAASLVLGIFCFRAGQLVGERAFSLGPDRGVEQVTMGNRMDAP